MILKSDIKIGEGCFIADNSRLLGSVTIEDDASIWFGAVLRGDLMPIAVKRGTNIQDNCTIHVNRGHEVEIGSFTTVGHNSVIHGCKVGNHVIVGMNSTILDGAEIGDYTIIGAGSLIPPNKKIPSGVLCLGSPAKVIRELSEDEKNSIAKSADIYMTLAKEYLKGEE